MTPLGSITSNVRDARRRSRCKVKRRHSGRPPATPQGPLCAALACTDLVPASGVRVLAEAGGVQIRPQVLEPMRLLLQRMPQ